MTIYVTDFSRSTIIPETFHVLYVIPVTFHAVHSTECQIFRLNFINIFDYRF